MVEMDVNEVFCGLPFERTEEVEVEPKCYVRTRILADIEDALDVFDGPGKVYIRSLYRLDRVPYDCYLLRFARSHR